MTALTEKTTIHRYSFLEYLPIPIIIGLLLCTRSSHTWAIGIPIIILLIPIIILKIFKNPKFGVYLLIFNLPINRYIPFFSFGAENFSISVNEILMFLVCLSWVINILYKGKLEFVRSSLNKPILFLLSITALSLIKAALDLKGDEFSISLMYFLLWAEYFLVYFLVINLIRTKAEVRIVVYILICSATIAIATAIYQQIIGVELRSTGVITPEGKTYYRLTSIFGFYSNDFGAYLLIIVALLLNFIFITKGSKRNILIFLLVPTFYTLVFTFSRGTFLGLLVLLTVLIILRKEVRRKLLYASFALCLSWIVIFSPILQRWSSHTLARKGEKILFHRNIRERLAQWDASFYSFLESPFLGEGFHTFHFRLSSYQSKFGKVEKIGHAHNAFIRILIESGLIGLLLFFWLIVRVYKTGLVTLKNSGSDFLRCLTITAICAFSAVLATSLTDSMFTVGRVIGPLWAIIGLMVVSSRIECQRKLSNTNV